jgi:hypothetical protein
VIESVAVIWRHSQGKDAQPPATFTAAVLRDPLSWSYRDRGYERSRRLDRESADREIGREAACGS